LLNGTLNFEDALTLVSKRALAMQKACEFKSQSLPWPAVLAFGAMMLLENIMCTSTLVLS